MDPPKTANMASLQNFDRKSGCQILKSKIGPVGILVILGVKVGKNKIFEKKGFL